MIDALNIQRRELDGRSLRRLEVKPESLPRRTFLVVLASGFTSGFMGVAMAMVCLALEAFLSSAIAIGAAVMVAAAMTLAPFFVLSRFEPLIRVGTTVAALAGAFAGFWTLGALLAH